MVVVAARATSARAATSTKDETAVLATVALDRMTDGPIFAALVPVAALTAASPDPSGGIRAGLAWGGGGSLVLLGLLFVGFGEFRRQAAGPSPFIRRVGERLRADIEPLRQPDHRSGSSRTPR